MMFPARILFLILLILPASWTRIAERNHAIERAERSYVETDFEESVRRHLELIDSLGMESEEVKFNLALSYQNNGQEGDAQKTYGTLLSSSHKIIPSFAANQMGVLEGREEKYEEALSYFKTALLKNPDNDYARYNYELLSRWMQENEEEQKDTEKDKSEEEDKIQPSNYAKRMKAQADDLVDRFEFGKALDLMNKALEIDETVSYYGEFINNLGEIKEIDEK